jgi:HK97 family phage portal protein
MSLARRSLEQRVFIPSGSGDPWSIPTNGSLAAVTSSGIPVTESTAMSLLSVNACVRILSQTLANLPFSAVRITGKSGKTKSPVPNQPMIMYDPFGGQLTAGMVKRREGIVQMMVSLLLRGNAYCLITSRDKSGRPNRLRVLHPDRVQCGWVSEGVRAYEIDRKPVPTENIVHIVGLSYPESPTGISVIEAARNSIGLGLAAEMFGGRFFGSGAHMTGIIEIEADLDKERARGLKEAFTASHGGITNSHTVGVLTGGAKWTPISVTPDDAQFLGTRSFSDSQMAMMFGVPPHLIMQMDKTTSWGTGIEQQSMNFLTYTMQWWVGLFEDAFTAMLVNGQMAYMDVSALLRTDEAGRYAVYSAARSAALLTQNEIRDREGYAPVDGGDELGVPLNSNVTPLPDAGAKASPMTKDALGDVL